MDFHKLILWKNPSYSFIVFIILNGIIISFFASGVFRYIVMLTTFSVSLMYLSSFITKLAVVVQRGQTTAKEKERFEASYQIFCNTIVLKFVNLMEVCLTKLRTNNNPKSDLLVSVLMVLHIFIPWRVILCYIGVSSWFAMLGSLWIPYKYYGIRHIIFGISSKEKDKFLKGPYPYICSNYFMDHCTKGSQCAMLHFKMPYQWVYQHEGYKWRGMNEDDNNRLESSFCKPSIENGTFSFKLDDVPRKYFVDFDNMVIIIGEDISQIRRLSTESQVDLPRCPFSTKWCWFWETDPGNFVEYQFSDVCASEELEKLYLKGETSYDFQVANQTYRLYFKKSPMYQQNKNPIYDTKRGVRRRPCFKKSRNETNGKNGKRLSDLSDSFNPLIWDKMNENQEYQLVKLGTEQEEYKTVKSLFASTMDDDTLGIGSIERLQNPFMIEKYLRKKAQMDKKAGDASGKNTIERHLFHGTKYQNVRPICKNNFDWRLYGKSQGYIHGQGAYFATRAKRSHAFCTSDEDGYCYMFVALVLVGSYTKGYKQDRTPPLKDAKNPEGDSFDSCVDRVEFPRIFVVFDVDQYYPGYLIKYKV